MIFKSKKNLSIAKYLSTTYRSFDFTHNECGYNFKLQTHSAIIISIVDKYNSKKKFITNSYRIY